MNLRKDQKFDVIIIGAGYAGRYAAARLITRNPDARVLIVDPHTRANERARSHEYAVGSQTKDRALRVSLPKQATLVRGHVVSLRPELGECDIIPFASHADATSARVTARAKAFVVATGSHGKLIASDGTVPALAVDDARLKETARAATSVAVVGAGLSGVEVACEFAEQTGAHVSIIADHILPGASEKARDHTISAMGQLDITHVSARGTRIEHGALRLSDDRRHECDLVIAAIGFEIADPFGLDLSEVGIVKATLQHARFENVYVAGDAAHQVLQTPAYSASCALAMPMGVHSAENINRYLHGQSALPLDYAQKIRCIGLGRRNGVVDFTNESGVPSNRVITGRLAAFVKEQILKMTRWALSLELKTGLPIYSWPKPKKKTRQLSDMRENRA